MVFIALVINVNVKSRAKKNLNKKLSKTRDLENQSHLKFDIYSYFKSDKEPPILARDPFFKAEIKNQSRDQLQLIGIAQDNNEAYAIINDIIVKKGSTIQGATVVDIQKDKVILLKNNEYIELQLLGL